MTDVKRPLFVESSQLPDNTRVFWGTIQMDEQTSPNVRGGHAYLPGKLGENYAVNATVYATDSPYIAFPVYSVKTEYKEKLGTTELAIQGQGPTAGNPGRAYYCDFMVFSKATP